MPDKALTDITIAEALDLLLATRQSRDNAVAAQSSMNDQIVALHRQIDQMQQAKLEAINTAPAPSLIQPHQVQVIRKMPNCNENMPISSIDNDGFTLTVYIT